MRRFIYERSATNIRDWSLAYFSYILFVANFIGNYKNSLNFELKASFFIYFLPAYLGTTYIPEMPVAVRSLRGLGVGGTTPSTLLRPVLSQHNSI